MKKIIFLTTICFVVLLWAGCEVDGPGSHPPTIEMDKAEEVVNNYMNLTLGSIPSAEINFGKARMFLVPGLQTQLETDPAFIPMSYCMQNGPDEVRITQTEFNEEMNWVDVVVEGKYGDWEWEEMWNFQVVPVEGDEWIINKIECLPM